MTETALKPSRPRSPTPLPRHVAIIMDGNGRWAEQRGRPRLAGHRAGTENIRPIIEAFAEAEVPYLTLYAFSTENWLRPAAEVEGLMQILADVIDRETQALHENGVRLRHLGRPEALPPALREKVRYAVELTRDNQRICVNVAFNYGGRAEILDAVRALLRDGVSPDAVTEELFEGHLYTASIPDPDLIIRTAGEMRLSNFLIWQAAYSEYYATPVLWPDFGSEGVHEALLAYSRRRRRFGAL